MLEHLLVVELLLLQVHLLIASSLLLLQVQLVVLCLLLSRCHLPSLSWPQHSASPQAATRNRLITSIACLILQPYTLHKTKKRGWITGKGSIIHCCCWALGTCEPLMAMARSPSSTCKITAAHDQPSEPRRWYLATRRALAMRA